MNHFQNLGGAWSFAFEPYYDENITQEFHNPKSQGIYDVEDMYSMYAFKADDRLSRDQL